MRPILERFAAVHLAVMVALYAVVIGLVFAQVIYRYGLRTGLPWSVDMAVAAFMWLIFLATAYGVKDGAHFIVDVLPKNLPTPLEYAVRATSALAILAAIGILIYFGFLFTLNSIPTYSASLGISRAWIIASIPVSGALALIYWIAGVRTFILGRGGEGAH